MARSAATTGPRERPLVLLIDGYNLIFRSYFVLAEIGRPMHGPDGTPTSGLYGFTTMVLNAIEQFQPDWAVIALDAHAPTFRDEMYADYKGTRDGTPDDLELQIGLLRDYLTDSHLPWVEKDGFEADDCIGTLATSAEAQGFEVAIISGDKDQLQLVSERITVFMPGRGTSEMNKYTPADVEARFGVPPDRLIDHRGLVGDASDNIPGVKGIGEKTAQKLLEQFPTIEELLDHLDEVTPAGVQAKLREGREAAILSKNLSRIERAVPLAWDWKTQPRYAMQPEFFAKWFSQLGFRTLSQRYKVPSVYNPPAVDQSEPKAESSPSTPAQPAAAVDSPSGAQVVIVQHLDEVKALVKTIKAAKWFAFDFETTDLNPRHAQLVGIAIAIDGETGHYIPVGHLEPEGDLLSGPKRAEFHNLELTAVLALLQPLWESAKIGKSVHNGKYEYAVCKRYGIHLAHMDFDTFVASYVLDPDQRHGLKDLALKHLDLVWNRIEELIGVGKKQITMDQVEIAAAGRYGAHDALATWRLRAQFEPQIKAEKLERVFYDIEMPLVPVLSEMEYAGIKVEPTVLRELAAAMSARLEELNAEALKITGGLALNLNSPKQLAEYLFEREKLPNTKKGSTDIEVLTDLLATDHPMIPVIMEFRELSKLKGTYTDGLLPLIEDDGRIHTSYNQGVASTGRLSSQNPNLQNIPIRTELGRQIRRAFIPSDKQSLLVAADYSQIELRLLAHYSKDPALLQVYRTGGDIHTETAVLVLGMDPAKPDKEKRRHAKVINFGIIYGMGAFRLAAELGIPQKEAQSFIDNYFARFAKVRDFFEQVKASGRERGYVETFLGRRRYVPDLTSPNGMRKGMAERVAMNMPLQGGASDLIKKAMVDLAPQLEPFGARMLLQVHDELVFEVPKKQRDDLIAVVGDTMANAFAFDVPIVVDLSAGPSWYDLKPVTSYQSK